MHSSQHNIMMSSNNTKKRRVGVGGGDDAPSLPSDDGEDNNRLVHDELRTLSSHMTNMMNMMSSMKGEIIRLTEKCDRMEKSIDTMQRLVSEVHYQQYIRGSLLWSNVRI